MGVNSGKTGTKDIASRYPVEEGLIAGTTKQTKIKRLVPEKSLLRKNDSVLL